MNYSSFSYVVYAHQSYFIIFFKEKEDVNNETGRKRGKKFCQ
jgi:hypothetical protein